MGAAYFSGLAVGFWKDIDEIEKLWKLKKRFVPKSNAKVNELIIRQWKKAVHQSRISI